MLFKELQKIAATIAFYDNKEGWRAFVEEVMKQDLPQLRGLHAFPGREEEMRALLWTKQAIGAGWYSRLIKPLPVVVEIVADVIRDGEGPAHARASLAGALAYLVQEKDIIPDDAGGGYGLVDDALITYYAYYKYLRDVATRLPDFREAMENYCREMEMVIRTGLRIFPAPLIGELRKALNNIAMGFYYLPEVPTYLLEQVIEQIIQQPHQNGIQAILTRLAYHLGMRFQNQSRSLLTDPVLSLVDALHVEKGVSPGELVTEPNYYYF